MKQWPVAHGHRKAVLIWLEPAERGGVGRGGRPAARFLGAKYFKSLKLFERKAIVKSSQVR